MSPAKKPCPEWCVPFICFSTSHAIGTRLGNWRIGTFVSRNVVFSAANEVWGKVIFLSVQRGLVSQHASHVT